MQAELTRLGTAHRDLLSVAARKQLRRAASSAVTWAAVAAVVVVGTILAITGVAGGLAEALGGRTWLANLITGAAVLGLAAAWMAIRRASQSERRMEKLRARYARFDVVSPDPAAVIPPPLPGAEHGPRS
jgi:phage shock protein PspC (stress-responsive transcriptional regulator)